MTKSLKTTRTVTFEYEVDIKDYDGMTVKEAIDSEMQCNASKALFVGFMDKNDIVDESVVVVEIS